MMWLDKCVTYLGSLSWSSNTCVFFNITNSEIFSLNKRQHNMMNQRPVAGIRLLTFKYSFSIYCLCDQKQVSSHFNFSTVWWREKYHFPCELHIRIEQFNSNKALRTPPDTEKWSAKFGYNYYPLHWGLKQEEFSWCLETWKHTMRKLGLQFISESCSYSQTYPVAVPTTTSSLSGSW